MSTSSNGAKLDLTSAAKRQRREARVELAKALREIAAEMQRPNRHRLPGHEFDEQSGEKQDDTPMQ